MLTETDAAGPPPWIRDGVDLRALAWRERRLRVAVTGVALCGLAFLFAPSFGPYNKPQTSLAWQCVLQTLPVLHLAVIIFGLLLAGSIGDRRIEFLGIPLAVPVLGWLIAAYYCVRAESLLSRHLTGPRPWLGWSDTAVVSGCDRTLCPTCGYSLVGNTSGTCPECGQPGQGSVPASKTGP